MMRQRRPPASRSSLLAMRRRLERVRRSTDLLMRKREALVRKLFTLAKPATDTRTLIQQQASAAYRILLRALAIHGYSGLQSFSWPRREFRVELGSVSVWGIQVSDIEWRQAVRRTLESRGTPPGSTGPAAIETANQFEQLVELLLDAAPREVLIRRLGEALATTTRRVQTLEKKIAPSLDSRIHRVRQMLDEREREEHGRLRQIIRRRSAQKQLKTAE